MKTFTVSRIRLTLPRERGMIDEEIHFFLPNRNGQAR